METKKTYDKMELEKKYSVYQMVLNLVDVYIDLQLNNPLVINKKEPKQYPDVAIECYVSSDKGQSYLRGLIKCMEGVRTTEELLNYGLNRYTRTEFFSKCFYDLTINMTIYDLELMKSELIKDCSIERNNDQYVNLAVQELSQKVEKAIIFREKAPKILVGKEEFQYEKCFFLSEDSIIEQIDEKVKKYNNKRQ